MPISYLVTPPLGLDHLQTIRQKYCNFNDPLMMLWRGIAIGLVKAGALRPHTRGTIYNTHFFPLEENNRKMLLTVQTKNIFCFKLFY